MRRKTSTGRWGRAIAEFGWDQREPAMALAREYARNNPGEKWCVRIDQKDWAPAARRFLYPVLMCFLDDPEHRKRFVNLNPRYEERGQQVPITEYGPDAPPFAVGDTLVLERHPIYSHASTPAYRETRKRLRSINVGTDFRGDPVYSVRFIGTRRVFRLQKGRLGGWSLWSGPPRPLRYEVIEHEPA